MKILSNHIQILSMIFVFKIEYPDVLEGTFNAFFSLSPDLTKAFSLDCFLEAVS